jgi:hypothetical protein
MDRYKIFLRFHPCSSSKATMLCGPGTLRSTQQEHNGVRFPLERQCDEELRLLNLAKAFIVCFHM